MEIKRMVNAEGTFEVEDIISFELASGEKVQAMAMEQTDKGMLFMLVDCLATEYRMNSRSTNKGGYDATELRKKLNGEILASFPDEVRKRMAAFDNGDYLRLPTEKEIFGENVYGEEEPDSVKQFEPMKERRNRIAFQGMNGDWEWYWLANAVKNTAACFASVDDDGGASCSFASYSRGVRPAFLLS